MLLSKLKYSVEDLVKSYYNIFLSFETIDKRNFEITFLVWVNNFIKVFKYEWNQAFDIILETSSEVPASISKCDVNVRKLLKYVKAFFALKYFQEVISR